MSLKKTDVKTPGIAAIAKKWNLSVAKVSELVNIGAKVEFEHNKNLNKARQVARDHINERPDYYQKLKKMEKTPVSMKEETGVGGVRGLGYTTGDPAGTDYVQQYINTNAISYNDDNGSKLDYLKKKHIDLHNKGIGYDFFDPTNIKSSSNFMKEESLNELGGMTGYEGISGPIRPLRKDVELEEGPLKDKAKKVAMAGLTAANMYTMADVAGRATEGGKGSPKADVVRAATALPGAAGWGATAVHYGKKGYDLARDALKKKKAKMEEEQIKEDLRKWFREKWVRYDTKGNIKGPCAREEGEGKPKCRPAASARAMSKAERAKSARRKRREDPVADRPGKGGKPINVQTEETLLEKNVPTNPALWARAKAQAKAKFDVYPSAYANGWASKWYKSKGGGWKSSSVDEENKYPESAERGIYEKHLTPAETKKKEEIVMSMKKGLPGMKKRYGERAKEVLYATATKRAKQVAEESDAADETNMAKTQLKAVVAKASNLDSKLKSAKNLPGWVQSKIAVAKDGITAVDDYMNHSDKLNEDGFDLDAVSNAIRSKESKNDYGAKSKSSSASGAYQYINKTWKGSASKYGVDTKQFPTARSAPKEVQDKVFTNDLQKNASKYGSLEKAVNVHYTGNPGGKVSAAGLKANRGQTGGGYMADIKKKVDDYNTERKSTMGAAQQMSANFSGGKTLSTPDSTQFAKADTPKPTQVASAPETPKMQNPDQNITKVASAPAPNQVSQLDTKDKQKVAESAAWQRKEGKNPEGGLNRKGIASYRRENPGSKLSMAVTRKPSTLDPEGKAAKRRKSFCARMGGMKGPMKDEKGRPTRKALALRKWNCEESVVNEISAELVGKVSNARFFRGEVPSKTLTRAINKKFVELGTKKEKLKKQVKENSRDKDHDIASGFNEQHHIYLNKTGMTHTLNEETTMDNNNLINEAIENILDNNLNEMKENLMTALQEKAQEKLEERKKLIAANYFAQ